MALGGQVLIDGVELRLLLVVGLRMNMMSVVMGQRSGMWFVYLRAFGATNRVVVLFIHSLRSLGLILLLLRILALLHALQQVV